MKTRIKVVQYADKTEQYFPQVKAFWFMPWICLQDRWGYKGYDSVKEARKRIEDHLKYVKHFTVVSIRYI